MKISVVVTTYNRPQALSLVLRALLAQRQAPFEILVADDGSGAPTREAIRQMARDADVPIRHLWQTDDGFRAASARNMAVSAAQGAAVVIGAKTIIEDCVEITCTRGTMTIGERCLLQVACRL
jgi:glycosyltransferase involved in cell wall biosynthesis